MLVILQHCMERNFNDTILVSSYVVSSPEHIFEAIRIEIPCYECR